MGAHVPNAVVDQFADQRWRLNNLYWILDKSGQRIRFELNWAQQELLEELHYLNLILKARQLGFTTFIQMYMLDVSVFFPDTRCGVIAHTLDDAQAIFRDKVKFPYDNLPEQIRANVPILRDNTTTLELGNNSIIRVGTSMRSGTLQYLHISEFGKICAKYPEKAREIVTGALNTIQAGQVAFIESTAEGQEGRFFDMCQLAQSRQRMGGRLSALDWKFHFFPWWREDAYEIDPDGVFVPDVLTKYFDELQAKIGATLSARKRAWYAKKAEDQKGDMKREFPSTPEEAFEASVEGAYYGDAMAKAEIEGRVGVFPAVEGLPVHTVHDIGVGDAHTIWFFQLLPRTVRLVGYYHNSGEGMPHYVKEIRERSAANGWTLGNHYLPHDAKVKEWGTGLTRAEQFAAVMKGLKLVPLHAIEDGINAVREVLPMCVFDRQACEDGLKALKNYRKEWDEERACWKDNPRHDWASHGADGFRYLAMTYREIKEAVQPPAPGPPKGITDMTWDQLMAKQKPKRARV